MSRPPLLSLAALFATLFFEISARAQAANTGQSATAVAESSRSSSIEVRDPYAIWFDRRLAVVESEVKGQNDAISREQTLISLIAVGFGALLTIIVIFFALRTERTASAAAAESARKAIAESKDVVEACVAAAERAKDQANEILDKIRAGFGEAEEHIAKLRAAVLVAEKYPDSGDESKEEIPQRDEAILRKSAEYLRTLSPTNWAFDDYKVLIAESLGNKDSAKAIEYAFLLRTFVGSDAAVAYSINVEGVAASRANDNEGAKVKYKEVIERFSQSTDSDTLGTVAIASRNVGIIERVQGNVELAKETFRAVVTKFSQHESPRSQSAVIGSLLSYAALARDEGNLAEAIDTLAESNAYLVDRSDDDVYGKAAQNLIRRAAYLREVGRFPEAAESMEMLIRGLGARPDLAKQMIGSAVAELRRARSGPEAGEVDPTKA